MRVVAEAESHDLDGLVEAVRRYRPAVVIITFLTDFGLQDDFVGTCHGVIKRIAPEAEIIDITHGIPPQARPPGRARAPNTLPYMPAGVHLAVVDPGSAATVARSRFATPKGGFTSGPTTACCCPRPSSFGGVAGPTSWRTRSTRCARLATFHGRDLFSPAAAHLAQGVELGDLGPPVARSCSRGSTFPSRRLGEDPPDRSLHRPYGNVQVNLDRDDMIDRVAPGRRSSSTQGRALLAVAARTFADARPGDILLYEDSYRNIALAINGGNAAEMLAARPDTISIGGPPRDLDELSSRRPAFARLATSVVRVPRPLARLPPTVVRSSTRSRLAGTDGRAEHLAPSSCSGVAGSPRPRSRPRHRHRRRPVAIARRFPEAEVVGATSPTG